MVFLDDFELHIYNRSGNYSKLEKMFSGTSDEEDETNSKDTTENDEKKR